MNLQTIQKRVEELSAELLTISNDLAHLLGGEIARQAQAEPVRVYRHTDVKIDNVLNFPADFTDICGNHHNAGNYKVVDVERPTYKGDFTVAISLTRGRICWLNFKRIAERQTVTKVGA